MLLIIPLVGVAIAAVSATAAALTTRAVGAKDREAAKYHREVNNELNNQHLNLQKKYNELQTESSKHITELTRLRLESEAEKDLLRLGLRLEHYVCHLVVEIAENPSYDLLKTLQESIAATNQVLFELKEDLIAVPPSYFAKNLESLNESLDRAQTQQILRREIYPIRSCPKCNRENRILPHLLKQKPICGSCGVDLVETIPIQNTIDVDKEQQISDSSLPCFVEDLGNGVIIEMIRIPSGSFWLGSPPNTGLKNEHPQQKIDIPEFYLSKYPVTQLQWETVVSRPRKSLFSKELSLSLSRRPSKFRGEDKPIEQVSWDDCQLCIKMLQEDSSKAYRLPSETEWEYACRAGEERESYFSSVDPNIDLDKYIWHRKNSHHRSYSVGQKKPNDFGLYDMLGNVWEWCEDDYVHTYHLKRTHLHFYSEHSNKKVLRGGSWNSILDNCRISSRNGDVPHSRHSCFGFRIACSSPVSQK